MKKFLTHYSKFLKNTEQAIPCTTTSLSIAVKLVYVSHQKADYGFPMQSKWLISAME